MDYMCRPMLIPESVVSNQMNRVAAASVAKLTRFSFTAEPVTDLSTAYFRPDTRCIRNSRDKKLRTSCYSASNPLPFVLRSTLSMSPTQNYFLQ